MMTKSKRVSENLRRLALAATVAGLTGAVAVPALAQDSVTTTQTTTTYDNGYTTTYRSGPVYEENGYAYPPQPTYTYVEPVPPPPAVGVGISVPFVHLGVGF